MLRTSVVGTRLHSHTCGSNRSRQDVRVLVARMLRKLDANALQKNPQEVVLEFVQRFTALSEEDVRNVR